jgi:hypothetical protein
MPVSARTRRSISAKDIDDLRRAVGVEKEMVNKHG